MVAFLVSKTYEVITPESAELGDTDDRGFEYQDREMDLRETVAALRECSELSQYPVTRENCSGHVWATVYGEMDYRDASETSYSYHVRAADGAPLSGRTMYRLLRLARLVK